jgi:hypothetical protein
MAEDWQAWCLREIEGEPQRRLWARIAPSCTHLVGQAGAELNEVEGQESDG